MSNNSSSGGVGLPTIVFVVFLILKLVGVIDWSWWWVFSPLLIPFVLLGFVLLSALGVVGVNGILDSLKGLGNNRKIKKHMEKEL